METVVPIPIVMVQHLVLPSLASSTFQPIELCFSATTI